MNGARLFARYAFAPNELGYCGPAQSRAMFELALTGSCDADPARLAQQFSGAWPYLRILADLTGAAPLDEEVVRAYWTGSDLLDDIDPAEFGRKLLASIGPRAGHYWAYLTPDLLPEVTPTHAFHVLAVYPWSRLLGHEPANQPLQVLQSCRIRAGQVVSVEPEHVMVQTRPLIRDGASLALGPPAEERVRRSLNGLTFVPDPEPGQWLALHWDWVCDPLEEAEAGDLERWTARQLELTNQRLAVQC